jgi:hypothetical protein
LKNATEEILITTSFYSRINYTISEQTKTLHKNNPGNFKSSHTLKARLNDIFIESYDDSIRFLKSVSDIEAKIRSYQIKHPNYKSFYNIVYSQPKDFLIDFKTLDLSIYDIENINKLLKIIYLFPKSEYYSFLAIDLLVFIALNSPHCSNLHCQMYEYSELPDITIKTTKACEFANISITEILESDNIHDYQKYLLLRRLYKNKEDLNYSFNNYSIEQVTYVGFSYGETPKLPFMETTILQINKLHETTNNFALKTLCNYLITLK